MEDDSAGNITDLEKMTKFSVSTALRQWMDVCDRAKVAAKTTTNFEKYLTASKWRNETVDSCLDEIAQLMLRDQSTVTDTFVSVFGPVLLDLLERTTNLEPNDDLKHKLTCVLLGKLPSTNKTVMQ